MVLLHLFRKKIKGELTPYTHPSPNCPYLLWVMRCQCPSSQCSLPKLSFCKASRMAQPTDLALNNQKCADLSQKP